MANVIIQNEERRAEAEYIMQNYGVDSRDSSMREAAEIAAARTAEAIECGEHVRRYF